MGGDFLVSAWRNGIYLHTGLIFMVIALVPCLVFSCNVVKNALWSLVTLLVSRVPSPGRVEVMLLECKGVGISLHHPDPVAERYQTALAFVG